MKSLSTISSLPMVLALAASALLAQGPSNPARAGGPGQEISKSDIERITVEELKAKLAAGEPITIIDVRSQGSYDSSDTKIKGAIRIPLGELESKLKEVPTDREIAIYCA